VNIFSLFYPDDHSRICLKRIDNDYINANLVRIESARRSYILTQVNI